MNTGDFIDKALQNLMEFINEDICPAEPVTLDEFTVARVGRLLGNFDALITVRRLSFQVIYNAARDEIEVNASKVLTTFTVGRFSLTPSPRKYPCRS